MFMSIPLKAVLTPETIAAPTKRISLVPSGADVGRRTVREDESLEVELLLEQAVVDLGILAGMSLVETARR